MSAAVSRSPQVWARDNQRHLALAAAQVAALLDGREAEAAEFGAAADELAQQVRRECGAAVAHHALAKLFTLTRFEASIVLAAAAPELGLTAAAGAVTFGRCLAALPDAHWSALLPDAALRKWRLLDVPPQMPTAELGGVQSVPLAADERVLHALVGADTIDERLAGRVSRPEPVCRLSARQRAQSRELAALIAPGRASSGAYVTGEDAPTRRQVALDAAAAQGLSALLVDGTDVPDDPGTADLFARLLTREAAIGSRVVLLDATALTAEHCTRLLRRLAADGVACVLSVEDPPDHVDLPGLHVASPDTGERTQLFAAALAEAGLADMPGLAQRHVLTSAAIARVVERVKRTPDTARVGAVDVEVAARAATHRTVHGLAQLRHPDVTLSELVLPEASQRALCALLAHVRQREKVHGDWGFERRGRGLAVTALFTGPSGTGKTTAAEALAAELGRDVLAVDLSQVVSKYIGETEKNLAQLFEAGSRGAVLLFDEGDALFGKRAPVRDARDRYANLEVSYLLQRLETFDGIAILTTNSPEAIDTAFTRRMRFLVRFTYPDAGQRELLWQRAFPAGAPTTGLDYRRLAQLSVSGGTITQLALHAAFIAADAGQPVGMAHVLAAAQIESDKLERPLSAAEIRGWT